MGNIIYPNNFVADTDAVAPEVNANFNAVSAQVNGNIDESNLANGAVTENKLGGSSVSSSKIQNDSVTSAKLANSSVSIAKIDGTDAANLVNTSNADALHKHSTAGITLTSGYSSNQSSAGTAINIAIPQATANAMIFGIFISAKIRADMVGVFGGSRATCTADVTFNGTTKIQLVFGFESSGIGFHASDSGFIFIPRSSFQGTGETVILTAQVTSGGVNLKESFLVIHGF